MSNEKTVEKKKPIDIALSAIDQAIEEWKEKFDEEKLKQKIFEMLSRREEEVALKLLGFDKSSYGDSWSIDHCNGRSGESAAGDFLRKAAQEAIKQWFSSMELPGPNSKAFKEAQTAAKRTYAVYLRDTAQSTAREKAKKDAEKLVEEMLSSDDFDSYVKAKALLNTN